MRATIALLAILTATAADACTTFCTRGLFGRNYDFEIGHGMVVVNKRGVKKTAERGTPWTSAHGSLTFNQFGRDNPTGGMNEKGLVVELMWMDSTRYPAADARPEVGTLEWIQYQLDNSANVDEVLGNAGRIRISNRGVPLHFLVADRAGNVATIEFLDGRLVVHRGDTLPVPVLANDQYSRSLTMMREGANDRFARAAKGMRTTASVDDAFAILDDVAQPHTQWSIVYDIRNLAVFWRTADNRDRRSLRFASLDFACATPVKVLDIHTGTGDIAKRLTDYTRAQNLALVRRSIRETSFTRETPDADIETSAKWPEKSVCSR
jgi:Linear amide C-N hydrolases, choloylglycine hydrolase family